MFTLILPAQENENDEEWRVALEHTGDVLQIAIPAGALIATIAQKDWQGTKQFALSYGSSILIMQSIKGIINKKRPDDRDLYDSFPSGHTTSAFSGASFIQRRYGWKHGRPAYVLASLVAISRIEGSLSWHDEWDILAGAVLGIGTTYIFTKPYEQSKVTVNFSSSKDGFLLSFNYRF